MITALLAGWQVPPAKLRAEARITCSRPERTAWASSAADSARVLGEHAAGVFARRAAGEDDLSAEGDGSRAAFALAGAERAAREPLASGARSLGAERLDDAAGDHVESKELHASTSRSRAQRTARKATPRVPSPWRSVLTFHGIGRPRRTLDSGEDGVWVAKTAFLEMLDAIAGRPDVLLTFDDGNDSDFDVVLPALVERGLTACFFVVAGRLDRAAFLSAAQICEIHRAGMSVGSHGMLHRPWRTLSRAELDEELTGAKRILEDVLGDDVTTAALPFGAYDRRVLRKVRDAGFGTLYTSDGGPCREKHWLVPRTTIRSDDTAASMIALVTRHAEAPHTLWERLRFAMKQRR